MSKIEKSKSSQDQRKYLMERLSKIGRDHREHIDSTSPDMPAGVKSASEELKRLEKITQSWTRWIYRNRDKKRKQLRDEEQRIKEVILFGTPEDALKAVNEFAKAEF